MATRCGDVIRQSCTVIFLGEAREYLKRLVKQNKTQVDGSRCRGKGVLNSAPPISKHVARCYACAMSANSSSIKFDPNCERCPRLASFLANGRREYPDHHCAPVAPFGDAKARLIIVGLAPGFHGANASGRPFTGDHAGILLYATLHRFGFSNSPLSTVMGDGLKLSNARITNAVKCVPPENKPTPAEIR